MSVSEFDEVVINLNILANLDQNKKLITKETYLNVEVNNMLFPESVKRWYRGDSRDDGIKKIDEVVKKALKILKENDNIREYLINATKGIENLKTTYSSDLQTVARLNTVIDKINRNLEETIIDNSKSF